MTRTHFSPTAGIEWAGEVSETIYDRLDEFSLLEFIPENFLNPQLDKYRVRLFEKIKKLNIPVIVHFTQLSVGSCEPFRFDHWHKLMEICKDLPIQSWTDHLCFTEMGGRSTGQLTPMFYNDDTLAAVCEKIKYMQSTVGQPIALENIAGGYLLNNQQYSETEFINLFQQKTGAGLLIDLNNLYSNGINFGIDPYQWMAEIDPDSIDSVHLAGGFIDEENFMQDGHNKRVPSQVWKLFEHLVTIAGRPLPTIIERTGDNDKGLAPIMDDVYRAQEIMDEIHGNNVTAPLSPTASL